MLEPMQMMTITLVQCDNSGKSLKRLNDETLSYIAAEFGGATASSAVGYWKDHEGVTICEPVLVVSIAAPATGQSTRDLKSLAKRYAIAADQQCVMIAVDNRPAFIEKPAAVALAS